ncbi:unnamed protein product [Fraxinus pennsylvanica]|uniref:Transcription factor CBF/NF-Y/archaeal histone domain-containing protein n=1 Tax=Fraxinus pennsylvanica TaxID=56036 RepID=A0AAD1ZJE0_9LAMI|nr:unnamed protein product [Fraxinus pennsylvanica]
MCRRSLLAARMRYPAVHLHCQVKCCPDGNASAPHWQRRCASVHEASDKCHEENRKTVNGDDLCWALSSLGFDNFSEVMLRYLQKFREFERQKSEQNKASSSEEKDEVTSSSLGLQPDTFAPLEFQILDKCENSSANRSKG